MVITVFPPISVFMGEICSFRLKLTDLVTNLLQSCWYVCIFTIFVSKFGSYLCIKEPSASCGFCKASSH